RLADLVGGSADVLVDLAPAWEGLLGAGAVPARPDWFAHPERARARVRLALQRVRDVVRDAVLVLVVDDVHYADRHSVEALRGLLDGAVLLVVAYPGKDPELLRELLDD